MSRRGFLKWFITTLGSFALVPLFIRFFTKLHPLSDEEALKPVPESSPIQDVEPAVSAKLQLSFFVLSDLHVSIYDESTTRKLKMALDDIVHFESPVDAVLLGGDLTDYGMESEYKSLESILGSYKLPPLHANMGNHDYYNVWIDKKGGFNTDSFPNGKTDAQSRARFQKMFDYAKPYHDVKFNGYPFILLSQEAYSQEMPEVGEGAWYSDAQLEWLKTKLEESAGGMPIFIFIHQPLPPEGQDGGSHRLIRAKAFREILKPYPNVFVISGHTHQDFDNGTVHYSKETFHWFVNASVGRTRRPQYEAPRSQGMYVQVYADRVVVRGREFTKKEWISVADWTIPLERTKATSL